MRLFAQRSLGADELPSIFGGDVDSAVSRNQASVRVNHDSALSDDAILAAVSLLAGDIASLPMKAFETSDSGLTQPTKQQPDWLDTPDPLDRAITDVAHKTQVALSVLLAGNAYVYCEPNIFEPLSLTVLNPVRIRVTKPNRERLFQVMGRSSIYSDWAPSDVLTTLSSAQVLHIPYMLRPGRLEGLSSVDAQSGNIAISLAMRKWVETFFGKGGQIAGLVSLPVGANETQVVAVQDRIEKKWSSWRRAGVIGVLSGGAQWMKTGLSPQDAALPDLWARQLEVAARIFGIPPFMVGSQEPAGVAYASSVERAQHYISHCMNRYTGPIEKAYSRLLPGSNTETRFVFDAFLRGDPKARWETYLFALQSKARIIDEVRALENLPPMGNYTEEQLAGPGGLLQTPNNNARLSTGTNTPVPADEAAPLTAISMPVTPTPTKTPPMTVMPGGKPA
jgi:HK97 family phage portal protein